MRDVSEKLRRLLYLVPYVARQPEGVPVDQLAELVSVDREQLLQDIDLLTQVGPPDGDPGEYLLVSVEDGRVFIDLPQRLTRPLRLTPAEGTGTVVTEPDEVVARHLRELVTSARQRTTVEIHYGAVSSARAARRSLDPYGIVHHAGYWYVVGHCHKRGDTRTFRIDRISSLATTRRKFKVPTDFDLEAYRRERLYVPSADAIAVRVHLDAVATARVGAAWPVGDVSMLEDGSSEIVIDCEGFEWVTGWVLGFGKHAWIVDPAPARTAMKKRVGELMSLLAGSKPTAKAAKSRSPR
jgi:proteasome accessory factor C